MRNFDFFAEAERLALRGIFLEIRACKDAYEIRLRKDDYHIIKRVENKKVIVDHIDVVINECIKELEAAEETADFSIQIDDFINKDVFVRLVDGRCMRGKLTCDSRYLKVTDAYTGVPTTFYGKDIAEITLWGSFHGAKKLSGGREL